MSIFKPLELEKFTRWLVASGVEVLVPTSEWEMLRFRTPNGVSVVYRNKSNVKTFTGESRDAYDLFLAGKQWRPVNRKRHQMTQRKIRLATRDSRACFFCGYKFPYDKLTVEHLLSIRHGGSDNDNNLVLACQPCNLKAGSLSVAEKVRLRDRLRAKINVRVIEKSSAADNIDDFIAEVQEASEAQNG